MLILETQCQWFTPQRIRQMLLTADGAGSGLDADLLDGQQGAYYLPAASYTAADVLTKIKTVDGAGSGLDADTLDGMSSADFVSAAGDTMTGSLVVDIGGSGGDFTVSTPGGASGFTMVNTKRADFRWDDDKIHILANTTNTAPATTQGITIENGGNVGIKNASPTTALDVTGNVKTSGTINAAADTDAEHNLGRARVGYLGLGDYAGFSHYDAASTGNYALLQNSTGQTFLNCATGQPIRFRVNNTSVMHMTSTGLRIGSDSAPSYALDITGALRISGNLGFFNTTPVARPAAYTQTYSTATRTHSNITAVAPSAYAGGANGYSTAAKAQEVRDAVAALVADVANIKQVLNQVIDDLQAYGLLQ